MKTAISIAYAAALLSMVMAAMNLRRINDNYARLERRLDTLYERQQTLADRESVADLREAVDSLQTQVTSLDQIVTRLLEDTPDDQRQADLLRWLQDRLADQPRHGRVYVDDRHWHSPLAVTTQPDASEAESIVHSDLTTLQDAGIVHAGITGETTYWHLLESE